MSIAAISWNSSMISMGAGPRPLVASQLPVDHWHEAIRGPTLANAILDRLVHNAYEITLQGKSMRKRLAHSDGSRPPKTNH